MRKKSLPSSSRPAFSSLFYFWVGRFSSWSDSNKSDRQKTLGFWINHSLASMAQTNPAQGLGWSTVALHGWSVPHFAHQIKIARQPDWVPIYSCWQKKWKTLEQPSMISSNLVACLLTISNTIHHNPMSMDTPIVYQQTSHHKLVAFVLDKSSSADPSWNWSMAILRKSSCKATMFATTILTCFRSICTKQYWTTWLRLTYDDMLLAKIS